MSFAITVSDKAVMTALDRLIDAVETPRPYLLALGEDLMARTKDRFSTASGPGGAPWAANSPVTLARYIASRGGIGKKGMAMAAAKRPLQGITGDLARQFHVEANEDSVTVGNSMKYAAMQQFGGTKAQFPNLWGDIPSRPFFPITSSGELYPQERDLIVSGLARYIQGTADGSNK